MITAVEVNFIIYEGGAAMFNFIDNSFHGVIPEDEVFNLESLDTIDNKVKGALMRSLGMAVKINPGNAKGKIYVRKDDVSTFLDARGNSGTLFARPEQLEKMMKNAIETSNLKAFFKKNHRYFDAELTNMQCGTQQSRDTSPIHTLDSISNESNLSKSNSNF